MKKIIIILASIFTLVQVHAFSDPKIAGTVHLKKTDMIKGQKIRQLKGMLFILVRKVGESSGEPFAVAKVENPTFPQAFLVGPKNTSKAGAPFKGPFWVTFKFVPDDDPLGKGGRVAFIKGDGIKEGVRDIVVTIE